MMTLDKAKNVTKQIVAKSKSQLKRIAIQLKGNKK